MQAEALQIFKSSYAYSWITLCSSSTPPLSLFVVIFKIFPFVLSSNFKAITHNEINFL